MKVVNKGRTHQFPIFRNIRFSFSKSYEFGRAFFLFDFLLRVISPVLNSLQPLIITKFVSIIENGAVQTQRTELITLAAIWLFIYAFSTLRIFISYYYEEIYTSVHISPKIERELNEKLASIKYGYLYSNDF